MKRSILVLVNVLFVALQFSCQNKLYIAKEHENWDLLVPPDSSEKLYSVYLIGDAGYANTDQSALQLLQSAIRRDSTSAVLFLGDNIYHEGMPADTGNSERANAEHRINLQLNVVKDYPGKIFFIPGNHDWDHMGREGLEKVRAQEKYVEDYLQRGNTFVPDGGCPGPFKVSVHENIVFILFDSQWWLHEHRKPYGGRGECEAVNESDLLVQIQDIIDRNKGKHIIVGAHHPLVSNSNHGGYYNALDHFFPLRLIRNRWYMHVPLPGLGSLYPLYRKFGGSEQDIPHYRYQLLVKNLMQIFAQYDNIIYVSGHDHNLQYHVVDENFHHLVSGSGSKLNPLKKGDNASFLQKEKGFSKITFYENGEAWVEFYGTEQKNPSFRTRMYTKRDFFPESYCTLSRLDYSDSTINVQACTAYQASPFSRFFFGDHYRNVWAAKETVHLLDLQHKKGGLIPYALGGGKQSLSLKLKNLDEREYVLRTINKDPSKGAIPDQFLKTLVEDMVQDQISAQHPYAAVTIPPMADKLNILHTRPQIVYVPADSCLGPYYDDFSNTLVMLEEDPDEDHSDAPNLGFATNIVGTDKMEEKLLKDNDNSVDEYSLVRTRLLDMLIGDWDRHQGQFRWAELEKEGKGELFVPVPEDRDQAYFKFDGVIPWLASRKWALRELQNFSHEIKDVIGMNFSAKYLDRRFLTSLTRNDWIAAADSVKMILTDEVIENAVRQMPENSFDLSGEEIISKLKSRRDQLPEVAEEYYELLARYVNVHGSNKHEKFIVERLNNDSTRVTIYKIKKDERQGVKKLYERTFTREETDEIRLYGFRGNDIFLVTGEVSRGILVRIIGGDDTDTIVDRSNVSGLKRHTIIYDHEEDNYVETGHETNSKLSDDLYINEYDKDEFFYTVAGPLFDVEYNQGDGFFLGAGFLYKGYKFRAKPYGVKHKALVSYASATRSTRVQYYGDFRNAFGENDLVINADAFFPYFAMNYFGYGNTSQRAEELPIDYYRVRMYYGIFNPQLVRRFRSYFRAGIGPKYEYYELVDRENSFLDDSVETETNNLYAGRSYAGLRGFFFIGSQDNRFNPTRGIIFKGEASYNQRLEQAEGFFHFSSEFKFYITPNLPWQLTFAGRIGGAANAGAFEFYQANAIGGLNTLRGHLRTRYIGDYSFYQNAEVRSELFKYNLYFVAGRVGILGFVDNGRVWPGGGRYHTAYGGGIWTSILQTFVLSAQYGISENDEVIHARLGFFF